MGWCGGPLHFCKQMTKLNQFEQMTIDIKKTQVSITESTTIRTTYLLNFNLLSIKLVLETINSAQNTHRMDFLSTSGLYDYNKESLLWTVVVSMIGPFLQISKKTRHKENFSYSPYLFSSNQKSFPRIVNFIFYPISGYS